MDTQKHTLGAGLARLVDGAAMAANVAGTLVVLGLVIIVNYDVVARGVFNAPFRGAYEVVQFSMVLIVFLQLPDVCRVNRLTRSDGLMLMLGNRAPGLSGMLRRAVNALSFAIMALIAYAVWPEFLDEWESGDYFGVPGIFTAPYWPLKLTITLSAALCAIIFLMKMISSAGSDRAR